MQRHWQILCLFGMVLTAIMGTNSLAADDQHPPVKIVLHPAAAPSPILKYRLLPPVEEQRPGNAAVWYLKVPHEEFLLFTNHDFWETIDKWQQMPLAELVNPEKKYSWVGSSGIKTGIFEELDYGTRCEWVNWDIPIRDHDFYSILLPEVQTTRESAKILGVRARLQIARGEYEDAIHSLRMGYALGRHVSQGPTIVQGLVGCTIVGIMSYQLETFIQQPEAPNLYWALASLPRPMIDFRQAFETHTAGIYLSHPDLRNLDKKECSPEQWQQLLEQVADTLYKELMSYHPKPDLGKDEKQWLAGLVKEGYPRAKQALITGGRSPAEVEAMPVPQVVLLYTMQTYDELRDDMLAALLMPYPAARKGIEQALAKQLKNENAHREIIPLAHIFLIDITFFKFMSGRTDRDIAELEILEAIRMYAAAHDGRLPESLKDITEVPIPIDPIRGEPFMYERDGNTAVLGSPSREDVYTKRYEIEMVGEKAKP